MAAPSFVKIEAGLRKYALGKPEATEHFPWGELAVKVRGKVFLFMRADKTQLSLSTKLAETSDVALLLGFAASTGYGLGKAGWVTATFATGEAPPVELLEAWIDESYRAIAPKKLQAASAAPAAKDPAARKPSPRATRPAPRAGRARAGR